MRSSKVIRAEVKRGRAAETRRHFRPGGCRSASQELCVADRRPFRRVPAVRAEGEADRRMPFVLPPKKRAVYRLRPIRVVGCLVGGNGELVRNGPRGGKRVALTFDDGPSDYTPEVLHILKRKEVKATFFMLGQQVTRYPSYARRVLALGHEIGNHSYDHAPASGQLRHPSHQPEHHPATHFRPCLFRTALRRGQQLARGLGPGGPDEGCRLGCRHNRLEAARCRVHQVERPR